MKNVLSFSAVELLFVTVSGMGLWFGFVLKTMLIIQIALVIAGQCLHSQGIFCLFHFLNRQRLEVHRRLSWDTVVAAVPSWPKHLSSQVTIVDDKALLSWRWLATSLLDVKYCINSRSVWLVCLAFALPTELPLPEITLFQVKGSEQLGGAQLSHTTPHQNIHSCSSALCKSIGSKLCSCCSKKCVKFEA